MRKTLIGLIGLLVAAAQAAPATPPTMPGSVVIPATQYTNGVGPLMIGNAADAGDADYGTGVLRIDSPRGRAEGPYSAQFRFRSDKPGRYMLWAEYAGVEVFTSPTAISFNGSVVRIDGLAEPTECYLVRCQKWFQQVEVRVKSGINTIRLANRTDFPIIRALALVPVVPK